MALEEGQGLPGPLLCSVASFTSGGFLLQANTGSSGLASCMLQASKTPGAMWLLHPHGPWVTVLCLARPESQVQPGAQAGIRLEESRAEA